MEVLTEKDTIFVPCIIRKSKDLKAVIDKETNVIVALPEEPVLELIQDIKEQLQDNGGFLDMCGIFLTDIITDNTGFPIGANMIFADHSYTPDTFLGFKFSHDGNLGNVDVESIVNARMGYDLFYTKDECN